jgi:hypothetical protein
MKRGSQVLSSRQGLLGAFWHVLCVIGLLSSAVWASASRPDAQMREAQEPEALTRGRQVAELFVTQSPTFHFDGIADSVHMESVRALEACPGCYEYTLYFESRHPGYGDRKGLGITPGLTPHRARLLLVQDRIITAVLDQAWDITAQRIVDFECTFTP